MRSEISLYRTACVASSGGTRRRDAHRSRPPRSPPSSERPGPRLGAVDQLVEPVRDAEPHPRRGGRGRQFVGRSHWRRSCRRSRKITRSQSCGHLVHVVRGEDDRDPVLVATAADEVADLVRRCPGRATPSARPGARPSAGRGTPWPASPASSGRPRGPSICPPPQVPDPEPVEQFPVRSFRSPAGHAVQPPEDVEVLGDREPPGQPGIGAGDSPTCARIFAAWPASDLPKYGSRPTSASACSAASGSSSSCRRRWARASQAPRLGPARRRADRPPSSASDPDKPSSARPPPARARRLGRSHRGRSCGSSTATERQGGCRGVPDDPADPSNPEHTRSPSGSRRGNAPHHPGDREPAIRG